MSRVQAAVSSLQLDLRLIRERRAEARALARAGSMAYAAGEPPRGAPEALVAAWNAAHVHEARAGALDRRLEESLASDRKDYREASAIGRWLVIARGVLERLWLRERIWRDRGRRRDALAGLARTSLECGSAASSIPAPARAGIERLQSSIQAAELRRAELLAPHDGEPLPRWLGTVAGESMHLLEALREQLERKFLLRLPALVAALAAWWLTRNYTSSSSIEALVHDVTGHGRAGLADSTLERLQFWLPLLAAALTVYLSKAASRYVQRRYES